MNDKIKELAKEAGLDWALKRASVANQTDDKESIEKFAGMLIDAVCDDMMSLEPMYPANIVALKIRQKYGVGSKVSLGSLDQYDDPAWQGNNYKNVDL
jgi:hypothetical protein